MEAGHFMCVLQHQQKVEIAKQQGAIYICGYCLNPIFIDEARFHCVECRKFDVCSSCFASLKSGQEHIATLHPNSEILHKHQKKKVTYVNCYAAF